MIHVISLGAGVQSSAVALMAAEGVLTPMPCAAVFADTQDEPAAVYDWIAWLRPRQPFPIDTTTAGKLSERELLIRRSRTSGRLYRRSLIPGYLSGGAPAFRHCTQEFKLRPLHRAFRVLAQGDLVTQWIGISVDEAHRMRSPRHSWLRNRYPLIELGMTRRMCREWFHRRGYPQPPRSACLYCPYHSDAEWDRMKRDEPLEFAEAVAFENRVQAKCDEVGQARMYLHRSVKPLAEIVFASDDSASLFSRECEGLCGV